MIGVLLGTLAAFIQSARDLILKKVLDDIDINVSSWSTVTLTVPLLFVALLIFPPESIHPHFWIVLGLDVALEIVGLQCYMKALKESDISLAIPLVSFTPLFMLITSPLMLGEFPSAHGLIGVLLIVVGSYILNISKFKDGALAPLKALFFSGSARWMLLAAFIWSITSNFHPVAIAFSSPICWAFAIHLAMAIGLTFVVVKRSQQPIKRTTEFIKPLATVGVITSLAAIAQMTAMSMTLAVYIIALKRCSVVFSTISGAIIYKESNIKERSLGTLVMFSGMLTILFAV